MKKIISVICAIATSLCAWANQPEEIILNEARFHKGDAPQGWMEYDFDDSSWQTIAIPEKWY